MRLTQLVAAMLSALVAFDSAYACMRFNNLDPNNVIDADVVVIAQVQNYALVGNHARFELVVQHVLKGKPPNMIPVAWKNSTFVHPKTISGLHLVALLRPDSPLTDWHNPASGARYQSAAERNSMSVLQRPCAPAFLVPMNDHRASQIRAALALSRG